MKKPLSSQKKCQWSHVRNIDESIYTISRNVPNNFSYPKDSSSHHISNINYPSIAISDLQGKRVVKVTRIVTNVGEEDETLYSPLVDAPNGAYAVVQIDRAILHTYHKIKCGTWK
ncbi:hypothetical protein JHK82_014147 [Glycine max]|nr:hypothetical protein JHK82_014147 [Glycine max]